MKTVWSIVLVLAVAACASWNSPEQLIAYEQLDYNYIARHTRVVKKSPLFVTYEYKNIRVDEIAPVAAQYCMDQGHRQASLYEITLHPNNARRATFVCKKMERN